MIDKLVTVVKRRVQVEDSFICALQHHGQVACETR